jgi:FMN phosphatase YigB (HAD superfamily)
MRAKRGAPMSIECILLDFDGTFTRVDDEAAPFLRGFCADLASQIGAPLAGTFDAVAREVLAEPDRYGWENDGRIVAPAHADPYILATTVGQVLLERAGIGERKQRTEILQGLYERNYPKSDIVFRADAKRVVEAVLATGRPVFVVTNSKTEHVTAKIEKLAPRGLPHLTVRGDARKFVIAEPTGTLDEEWGQRWSAIPESIRTPGLARPVYLHRGHYFDAIRRILDDTGVAPEQALVCGDIWELDLSLPAAMGMRTHLVARPGTPEHERKAVVRGAFGTVSTELSGVLEQLDILG